MKVRLAIVQYEMREIDRFEDFAAQCRYFVESAAGYKADFILFPEMVTNQLLSATPGVAGKAAVKALDAHTDRYLKTFTDMAKEFKINIVGGSHFTTVGGKVQNVAHLFHRSGKVDRQGKIHVTPSERAGWGITSTDAVDVFDTDKGKVAIQICYDVEFPEPTRLLVEKGAQILFVPFCTDDRQGYLRVRYCAQARCVENQIYVATAGVVGNLRGVKDMDVHYAVSGIFTPSDFGFARDGIAVECAENREAMAVQDVDLAQLEEARRNGTVRNWQDRRTDLYQVAYLSK